MGIKQALRELQELDLAELSMENLGSWPVAVKVLCWALVLVLVLVLGHQLTIADRRDTLAREESREQQLRDEFAQKVMKAANLDALREQMADMQETFGALVSQLPSDTEVPGLLEDMTNLGVDSGLEIESITLQPERSQEFYIELPIKIIVTGGYHELGTFVSGIAGLPRIVTLHDFHIRRSGSGQLTMAIDARTYRYKDV